MQRKFLFSLLALSGPLFGCDVDQDPGNDLVIDNPDTNDLDNDGWTSADGDCDDSNPAIHPDADEICDEIDNNCDLLVDDEDPLLDQSTQFAVYQDSDQDGFGDDSTLTYSCTLPDSSVEYGGDCDDTDPTVYPGAIELCDGQVNDCDNTSMTETPYVRFTDQTGAVTDMTQAFSGTSSAPMDVTIDESGVVDVCGDFYATVALAADELVIRSSPGGYFSSLDAAGADHVIRIAFPNSTISIENLLITGGKALDGGGIFNPQNPNGNNSILVSGCEITGNHATDDGGGIHIHNADLMIQNSLVHGNTSANAGCGIYQTDGFLDIQNSEIYENKCGAGAGIWFGNGELYLENSSIYENEATASGGGILVYGSKVLMVDSFISNNTGGTFGGGIMADTTNLTCRASFNHSAGITGNTGGFGGALWVQTNGGDPSYEIRSENCDWGTDVAGNNNQANDIQYSMGSSYELGQLVTSTCNIAGCQ